MTLSQLPIRVPLSSIRIGSNKMLVYSVDSNTITESALSNLSSYHNPKDLIIHNSTVSLPNTVPITFDKRSSGYSFMDLLNESGYNSNIWYCSIPYKCTTKWFSIGYDNSVRGRVLNGSRTDVKKVQFEFEYPNDNIFDVSWTQQKNDMFLSSPEYIKARNLHVSGIFRNTAAFYYNEQISRNISIPSNIKVELANNGIINRYITHISNDYTNMIISLYKEINSVDYIGEKIVIDANVSNEINECRQRGSKITAIDSTILRSLESTKGIECNGYINGLLTDYSIVDKLLTRLYIGNNTSFLSNMDFIGVDVMCRIYEYAKDNNYAFGENGDYLLILK